MIIMEEAREYAIQSMMDTLRWPLSKAVMWESNVYNSQTSWADDTEYTAALYKFIDNAAIADKLKSEGANL